MKFSYRLSKICGNIYENGNLIFTPDGNTLLSPIGNRITLIDLIQHTTQILPFENKKNIRKLVISHSGRFVISVDVDGHALFINLPRQIILTRFHFKKKVMDIKFSSNDKYFAVTYGRGCQIWKTPSLTKEFSPLVLYRTLTGFHDDTTCLQWGTDSQSLVVGSKDLTARVYYRVLSKKMALSVLSGHRAKIIGAFYSNDNEQIYTVATDGAIFTWQFEYGDRIVISKEEPAVSTSAEEDDEKSGSSEEESENDEDEEKEEKVLTKRGGMWKLKEREFLWDSQTEISSASFNPKTNLLVVGFTTGIFGLYSMPNCQNIHKLSVSHNSINSVDINATGEWLAIGSKSLGQLLVWEWQSESYVIKQQGHMYGLNALDFSSDGMYIASGGEDAKVKVWNVSSGFCFVTFSKHLGPVTGVKFIGKGTGKAVISSSLDGTVRAYDLVRYQNFRTLTTPTSVQLTSLAVDSSGEMVCAGAMDPFQIFVWSLQTGKLLDVLSGHEGPLACLTFAQTNGRLASGSWDGTLKIWDIYKNECVETFEHGCDVMAIAFRPDGKEVCTATTNGLITFWDVDSGSQLGTIEGRKDISVGRKSTDFITSKTSAKTKYFTCLAYTADGSCILAGSQSRSVCIYSVASGTLVKKFELSHNRSLEGTVHELRSDMLVDGVALERFSDDEDENFNISRDDDQHHGDSELLPGAGKGSKFDGSRNTAPEMLSTALGFSPTGREWAAATTQGLQIFSLDEAIHFAPTDLDMSITPQSIRKAIREHEYTHALNMALHLAEREMIKEAVDSVAISSIPLVVKSIDLHVLKKLLRFLADEIASSRHIEYYLRWCWSLLSTYGQYLQGTETVNYQESFRSLIRAISIYEQDIMRMCDENHFVLEFLQSQGKDFLDIKPSSASLKNGSPEEGGQSSSSQQLQVKQKLQSLSTIPGYREKKQNSTPVMTDNERGVRGESREAVVEEEEVEQLEEEREEVHEEEEAKAVVPKQKSKKMKRSQEEQQEEKPFPVSASPSLKAKKQKVTPTASSSGGKKSIKKLRANR